MIHRLQIPDLMPREFPAGRASRVFAGIAGLPTTNFVMGQSTVYPRGSIPLHHHPNEEVYVVIRGEGVMTVGEETLEVSAGTAVYLQPNIPHDLRNTGGEDLILMFVYAPVTVVDHWAEELREGKTKR